MNVAVAVSKSMVHLAPRTRVLLTAPVLPTLLRLSAPNLAEAAARITFLSADAAFVSWLGSSALAAVALAFPLLLIIQTFTASGFGAGVSASVGQALGAGDQTKACRLANSALVLALVASFVTTTALLSLAPSLYRVMGARGDVLDLATSYSRVLFSGIGFVWLMNLLANVSRGAGNMIVPASAIFVGEACHLLLSPALILGCGPLPKLGITGAAIGALSAYVVGTIMILAHLVSGRALARIGWASIQSSLVLIAPILRIGAPAATAILIFGTVNLAVLWLLGKLGSAELAAYGVASRLDSLLYPLVFAFGSSVMTMMATAAGADDFGRAASVARKGCAIGACIGLLFMTISAFGEQWMALFTNDPPITKIGTRYLHWQAPVYPLFASGIAAISACYAVQLTRLPLIVNSLRLAVVLGGGWLALRFLHTASAVFATVARASAAYGVSILVLLHFQLASRGAQSRSAAPSVR
jgi:putative MATE family efflux protein